MTRTILLIDGDPIAYACAAAHETRVKWDDGEIDVQVDVDAAVAAVDAEIEKIKADVGVQAVRVALSVSTLVGWRRAVLPTYKANRASAIKPAALQPCRDRLVTRWDAVTKPMLEADDVLGIWATKSSDDTRIIVSIDKDLAQVPGQLYNPRHQSLVSVTEEEADRFHLLQTLTGDTVDGYRGLPGCGPARANKILDTNGATWASVIEAYETKGLTEDDALVQARVARICRASDYDFKTKAVRLWTPPRTEENAQ
jgi:DNA polymerase-1